MIKLKKGVTLKKGVSLKKPKKQKSYNQRMQDAVKTRRTRLA